MAQQVTSHKELRERVRTNAEAYFFVSDSSVIGHAALMIDAANILRLPTMIHDVGVDRAGALAGYGPDFREYGRRSASYVARILAGTLPRDLPVESANQHALAMNLKNRQNHRSRDPAPDPDPRR